MGLVEHGRRMVAWALGGISLRARIAVLVLFAALPGVLLAEHVAQETRQHTIALMQDEALRLARKAAVQQEGAVEATRQLLSTMAALPGVRAGSDCAPLLQAVLSNPGYNWVAVLDASGQALCGAPVHGRDQGAQPWFVQALGSGEFTLGDYAVGGASGRSLIVAALPLAPSAEAPGRVMAIGIDLGWLSQRLAATEHPEAAITIVDKRGVVLARHPEQGAAIGRRVAQTPIVAAALAGGGEGTGVGQGLQGGERAYGFARLGSSGAVVIAGLPTHAAWAEADRIYYRSLGLLLLLTCAMLLVVVFAADRLVLRPLSRLASAARALSRGNLHVRAGLTPGSDEIGQLARSFDGMAAAVEAMVLERTAALRDSEERFRLAVRFAPVIVFCHDRELRYTWIQGRNLHLPAESWIGRTDAEMFGSADTVHMTNLKRRVLEDCQGLRETVTIPFADGPRAYDLTIEPLRGDDGAVTGLLCAAIDMTLERRRQAELDEARTTAEQANQAKTRFLAAASHDLRQPLQAMNLYLHLLTAKLTTDEQRNIAGYLGQSAEAATSLLDTLMGLSALETGQVAAAVAPTPLAPLLQRVAAESRAEAESKHLRISVRAHAVLVETDPVLLERMVRNLVKNAIRYTDAGRILLAARPSGDQVRIEVWDTGRGIPEEKLQAIFQDFYQVPGSRPVGERGLGLGLSTVARMGRLLGHETGVRSRLGHGSVFHIRVPRARQRLAA